MGQRGYKTDDWSKELPLPVRAYRSTWFSLVTGKLYRQVAHPVGDTWVEESVGIPTLAQVLEAGNVMENLQQIESENGDARLYIRDLEAALEYNDKKVTINNSLFQVLNDADAIVTVNFATNRIALPQLETYADDTAAGAAGLTAKQLYMTPTGELKIKL